MANKKKPQRSRKATTPPETKRSCPRGQATPDPDAVDDALGIKSPLYHSRPVAAGIVTGQQGTPEPEPPYRNQFLRGLSYPSGVEFPYPAHDTGIVVTGMVLNPNPWDEDNMPEEPFQVRGTLFIRPSPFGGFQCFVIGSPTDKAIPKGHKGDQTNYAVDPETVQHLPEKGTKTGANKPAKR